MRLQSKIFICICCFSIAYSAKSQDKNYIAKTQAYQKAYLKNHEVVLGKDRKHVSFFPVDENYRVISKFAKLYDTVGFVIKTAGKKEKKFFRYGKITFSLYGNKVELTLYQSQQLMTDSAYKNYLFLPFTDLTSGEQSYGGGRYLDPKLDDIKGDSIMIDFNQAYNPYCAYTSGYNCPIPPRENNISIAIKAGEKSYGRKKH